jgi:very-short-patch-repair endonuclease
MPSGDHLGPPSWLLVDGGVHPRRDWVTIQPMDAVEAMHRCGGVADHATVVRLSTRRRLRRALAKGAVVRTARGRYALPTADVAAVAAQRVRGVVSHRSAAAWWGWALKQQPSLPEVTVPKDRRCARDGVALHWADLQGDEIREGMVTSRERTLVDCLRSLPFDEALAIADSALRAGDLTPHQLRALAAGVKGPGAPRVRRVARHADGRADNPFESVLRALAIEEGLDVIPQLTLRERGLVARPDLVDEKRGLILEADSFEWHGGRAALRRDCRRYNAMVLAGWLVLRFAWEDVVHDQDYVRSVLRALTRPPARTEVGRRTRQVA